VQGAGAEAEAAVECDQRGLTIMETNHITDVTMAKGRESVKAVM